MFKRTLLLIFICLNGCAVSDRVVYTDSEGVVPDRFFAKIKNKKTHKDWVVSNLGQPHVMEETSGVEFLTYHFAKSRYRKVSVALVLNRGLLEEEQEYYHVMVCEDVVERAWFDKLPSVDTQRYAKKSKCAKETS